MKLQDIPFVLPLAEWVWGADTSTQVSPDICLDHIPFGLGEFIGGGCLSQLITKGLGVAIILGSCLNKTPIMANMMASKSSAGFSRIAMYSESFVYANGAAYGILESHPLTAYGENLALCAQNVILIVMIWNNIDVHYGRRLKKNPSSLVAIWQSQSHCPACSSNL